MKFGRERFRECIANGEHLADDSTSGPVLGQPGAVATDPGRYRPNQTPSVLTWPTQVLRSLETDNKLQIRWVGERDQITRAPGLGSCACAKEMQQIIITVANLSELGGRSPI